MSYLVSVTFDLEHGDSEDYQTIYDEFEDIGLKKVIRSSQGNDIVLPSTTTAGEFSADSAVEVRDDICTKTKAVFTNHGYEGEIFVHVGGDWAWGHRQA
jgi:hypothetical protein